MKDDKSRRIILNKSEFEFRFIRSPGPGGQNVNKVATTVVCRFNVMKSSLSSDVKNRLIKLAGNKITTDGELVIKASRFRTQERNKQDAVDRLNELIKQAAATPKKRKKTKPTQLSKEKRLAQKKSRSNIKSLRRNKPHRED